MLYRKYKRESYSGSVKEERHSKLVSSGVGTRLMDRISTSRDGKKTCTVEEGA